MRYHSAVDSDVIEFVRDRKSTRLNSNHGYISYAVFCLKKKKKTSLGKLETLSTRNAHPQSERPNGYHCARKRTHTHQAQSEQTQHAAHPRYGLTNACRR